MCSTLFLYLSGIIFCLLIPVSSFAQNQYVICGASDEWFYTIRQTTDSNLIMIGSTYSYGAGNSDILLVKTNKVGDTLWTKIYGGTSVEYGYDVRQTSDGGYILCGQSSTWNPGNYDAYLIRINSNGDTLWTKVIGGDRKSTRLNSSHLGI